MEDIRLEKLKSNKPTDKTRITAFLILFLLIALVFFTIKKYGQGFITFLIFVLLLLIPVFIMFEEDIVKIFGYKYDTKLKKKNRKINTKKSRAYQMMTSKTAKQIITLALIVLSIVVSIVLVYKSTKLDQSIPINKRKILFFLLISMLLMINTGTLAMVYF